MNAKIWFLETRPQFLILSVVLAFLGATIALYDGSFHWAWALLAGFGLVLAHASCNVLNDYFDFRSGVDLHTRLTPFSGGSGILPAHMLTQKQTLWLGIGTLLAAFPIGVYFIIVRGWMLLPLLLVAAFCVVLYSPLILRLHWPEWAPGVGLGILPVMGIYFAQTGGYTIPALVASLPSGIFVHNLLLLNEFPDVEADKVGKRKTMTITLGSKKASYVYSASTLFIYAWIIGAVVTGFMPRFCLIALLMLPLAVITVRDALKFSEPPKLMAAMKNNVLIIMLTQVLLGVGYILANVLR